MKKYICFLLLFLLIPLKVNAASYTVPNFYIDAKIDKFGNMQVRELIIMDGTFNGNETILTYRSNNLLNWTPGNIDLNESAIYNGSSIRDVRLYASEISANINFETINESFPELELKSIAYNGEKGIYTKDNSYSSSTYRMYYPANNSKVAFLITYTIENVVVIHEDVAEIFWPFIDSSYRDDVKNIEIHLTLPEAGNTNSFRTWIHSNIYSEIDHNENIGAIATVKNYRAGYGVDIRMTFDKKIITQTAASKLSKMTAFDKIIEIETKKADEINAERSKADAVYNFTFFGSLIYIVILIVFWIYIYSKYDREYQSNFKGQYYREFIDDYNVEVIDYLMNKRITPNAMSASIMNLIYKKNISVHEIHAGKSKNKSYEFCLDNRENITETEEKLIDFLFSKVGKENRFTNEDLKKYARSSSTYSDFNASYTSWENTVIADGQNQNFYESTGGIKALGIIYVIIGFIIFFLAQSAYLNVWTSYLIFPLTLVFLIYIFIFTKRTKKGNDHYYKMKAFKKFLLDFSILPKRELPEIAIWERYMVYATILGIADKVKKAMNVRINEFENASTYTHMPFYHYYFHMNLAHDINRSINSAITSAASTAAAHQRSASGGGFGGGSSGGGGGGFGGGGHGGGGF